MKPLGLQTGLMRRSSGHPPHLNSINDPGYTPLMRTLTVSEAQNQLRQLIQEVHNGGEVVLADGDKLVKLRPYDPSDPRVDLDLEEDSLELEAELLKAVEGSHAPYSHEELEALLARVVTEERERRAPRDG
jgi:amphi-Trp domain-containing protein